MKNISKLFSVAAILVALVGWSCQEKDSNEPASVALIATKVIAHRGAWLRTGAPENSVASLQAAIRQSCYGSEFDLQMSSDSVLFVSAGDSVAFTGRDSKVIKMLMEQAPFDSLSKIKLANAEPLPTLETYLDAGKNQAATRLIIRLKPFKISKSKSLQLARYTFEAVKKQNVQSIVNYASADYDVCKTIRGLDVSAKVSYLGSDKLPEQIAADKISETDYTAEIYVNDIALVKKAQDLKLTANAWLINSQALMEYLIWKKMDYITTDEPELLNRLIKK